MKTRDPFRVMSIEIGSTAPLEVLTHAACKGSEHLMRATNDHRARRARNLCNSCPVLTPCREWALQDPDPVPMHVAGGLTVRERRRLRNTRVTVPQ